MPETPIDAAAPLAERPFDPDRAVGDCRHRLTDPGYGEGAYRGSHVSEAVFAHAGRVSSGVRWRGRPAIPPRGTAGAPG